MEPFHARGRQSGRKVINAVRAPSVQGQIMTHISHCTPPAARVLDAVAETPEAKARVRAAVLVSTSNLDSVVFNI